MVRIPADEDEKPLLWVGSSKANLWAMPAPVRREIGAALGAAQFGAKSESAKPWHGVGPGTFEVVEGFDGRAFRAVYTVAFRRAVYVLHAFEKKSTRGIKTPQHEVDLVRRRLRSAQEHYRTNFPGGG